MLQLGLGGFQGSDLILGIGQECQLNVYKENVNVSSTPFSVSLCPVDADEIKRLGKRFKKLDLDNSGSLSVEEFMSLPELQQNPLVQRVIDIFDTDGNGEVDFKGMQYILPVWACDFTDLFWSVIVCVMFKETVTLLLRYWYKLTAIPI